jgi:RNA polymerase sigma-70 factor (ECF subfamily)
MKTSELLEEMVRHLPSLFRMGRRLTKSEAEAEDLVQDTLVRALSRSGELRDPARLRAWLLTIERSVFLNSRRGLRPRLEVLEGGLSSARREPIGDLESELVEGSLSDELHAALDALPEEQREALWLREVDELTYDEIARVQECPVGTVRSRLARARGAMIEHISGARGERKGSGDAGL